MKAKHTQNIKVNITNDPGFGVRASQGGERMMNANGSFNVKRVGLGFSESINPYHSLINMPWGHFNLIVLITYVTINTLFAFIYYFIGVQYLVGAQGVTMLDKFWEAFFFSAQTLTTVGYGRVSPIGMPSNIVASIESMTGLLGFALATGILYGRFSRPNAKLLFSKNAVMAPYQGGTGLMFRIANARNNQLIEAEAQFMLSWVETENGFSTRKFFQLPLERNKISFLALSWTIVHPIDENSPLWNISEEELLKHKAEFLVIIKAFDDTFSQTVHARASYKDHELIWGAKFVSMYKNDGSSGTVLELDKIGIYEKVEIPLPFVINEN